MIKTEKIGRDLIQHYSNTYHQAMEKYHEDTKDMKPEEKRKVKIPELDPSIRFDTITVTRTTWKPHWCGTKIEEIQISGHLSLIHI